MEINLTVAQVLINRGFNQTEIARLSGVHRVTITNIANLFYSGTTSEQKIKTIINNLQLTNDEKILIHKAMYHVPIAMQENETVNNPTPIAVTPVNTEVPNKVIHEINQSNVAEIINKYANSNGTCMFCNMYIQHNCTAGYYNGKFVIMCHQCWAIHRVKIEPVPQY